MTWKNPLSFQGNGTKSIVVFGNSHARTAHLGIEEAFRGVYKHLSLFARNGCMIIPWPDKLREKIRERNDYKKCISFMQNLFKILDGWQHKIDVIIVIHA
jgi:hypothetical protein